MSCHVNRCDAKYVTAEYLVDSFVRFASVLILLDLIFIWSWELECGVGIVCSITYATAMQDITYVQVAGSVTDL